MTWVSGGAEFFGFGAGGEDAAVGDGDGGDDGWVGVEEVGAGEDLAVGVDGWSGLGREEGGEGEEGT